MIRKPAGKKQGEKERLKNLSVIHNIKTCPLYVYIDAVCEDNLKGLIVSGSPSEEDLKIGLAEMTAEFSALCGNGHTDSVSNSVRRIYELKNTIMAYLLAVNLIHSGDYSCLVQLRGFGITGREPKNDAERDKLLKLIEGKSKGKTVHLKEELKRFDDLTKDKESRATAEDYAEQIAAVSKFAGFHINKMTITLSDYAGYVKLYNKSIKHIPNGQHE